MSQYIIIYKYGKSTRLLKIQKGAKKFWFKKKWRPAKITLHRSWMKIKSLKVEKICLISWGRFLIKKINSRLLDYRPIWEVTSRHVTWFRDFVSEDWASWSFRAMVNFCAVLGCSNCSNREKVKGYCRIPPIVSRSKPKKQALRVERRAP